MSSDSAVATIKTKLVPYAASSASDFTGGLVGINTSGMLYNETTNEQIREYRYSGVDVDNYIYYNCPDTAGGYNYGSLDYDYKNNCEKWRIVGIFNENGEEFLKIMKYSISGNQPTWTVKVGLLYPSDYGYSASNLYWETDMRGWNKAESDGVVASTTSWFYDVGTWFLSPGTTSDSIQSRCC